MPLSAFTDKRHAPTDAELRAVLGKAYGVWTRLLSSVGEQVSPLNELWGFTSASTGWGLRVRCGDRVILYMTPQEGRFLASLALGEKAVEKARGVKLPAALLAAIDGAPKYAEGRGVRVEVTSARQVAGLARLARIKHES